MSADQKLGFGVSDGERLNAQFDELFAVVKDDIEAGIYPGGGQLVSM